MSRHLIENIEGASDQEFVGLLSHLCADRGLSLEWTEKAVRTPSGEEFEGDFESWFMRDLQRRFERHFVSAREQIWRVVETYLEAHGGLYSRLTQEQILELQQVLFDAGLAHTSHMVGIRLDSQVGHRLRRWGWTEQERADFPGWAYRFGVMRGLIEAGAIQTFAELLRAAMSHPLSDAERNAIAIAELRALNFLQPVFNELGRLITGELLERERAMLRTMVADALRQRAHPLVLARDMFKADRALGIFRDFERLARTELANAFSEGSFQADRESGKFGDEDFVFRIPRPGACKICIALFVDRDGRPRLFRVQDLTEGVTPEIDVGVRAPRLYRATIGQPHPNCLCAPWQRYWGKVSDGLFKRYAPQYVEARERVGLPVREAA